MGEIRIVGPGKTRGYPYPVCKKDISNMRCVHRSLLFLITVCLSSSTVSTISE